MERRRQLLDLIAKYPEDETLRFTLGRLLAEAGEHAAAVECFEASVRLKPDFTPAWLGLGKSLAKAGRPEDARSAYGAGLKAAARTKDEMTRKAIESLLKALG